MPDPSRSVGQGELVRFTQVSGAFDGRPTIHDELQVVSAYSAPVDNGHGTLFSGRQHFHTKNVVAPAIAVRSRNIQFLKIGRTRIDQVKHQVFGKDRRGG